MQVSQQLFHTFLDDGKSFTRNIRHLLLERGGQLEKRDLLQQLFRNSHSIKSEAAYIGIDELAQIAHEMENLLERGIAQGALGDDAYRKLLLSNDRISEVLDYLAQQDPSRQDEEKSGEHWGVDREEEPPVEGGEEEHRFLPAFTPFQKELLMEARGRGEGFYRLSICIGTEAPMPFAKAYLILSNLEQTANVIRVSPSFESGEAVEDPQHYRRMIVFFTSSQELSTIYSAVNLDQLSAIRISPLSYSSLLDKREQREFEELRSDSRSIRLEPELLGRLSSYIEELQLCLYRARRGDLGEGLELSDAENLVNGLEKLSAKMQRVHLQDLFSAYREYLTRSAQRLSKKINFEIDGADIDVDRRIAEILSETLLHLLRNSIDHGIETPEERLRQGKEEQGSIRLSVQQGEGGLEISVYDDGRGIDLHAVKTLSQNSDQMSIEGAGGGRANELAALLSRPGFSTREDADEFSGRGYGLDIVYRKIGRIEGAYFEADSKPGAFSRFTVSIPGGLSFLSLQMLRWEKMILALPERSIVSRNRVGDGRFGDDGSGRLLWNDFPVFCPEGQVYATDYLPKQEVALLVQHLDTQGVFLVDELLFSREIPEEQCNRFIEESPFLYSSSIGGRKAAFYYISPAFVTIEKRS